MFQNDSIDTDKIWRLNNLSYFYLLTTMTATFTASVFHHLAAQCLKYQNLQVLQKYEKFCQFLTLKHKQTYNANIKNIYIRYLFTKLFNYCQFLSLKYSLSKSPQLIDVHCFQRKVLWRIEYNTVYLYGVIFVHIRVAKYSICIHNTDIKKIHLIIHETTKTNLNDCNFTKKLCRISSAVSSSK